MAENNRGDSLPSGWVRKLESHRDGSKIECYTNLETGQTFYSKEDLLHHVNYARTILPLISENKLTYTDLIKQSAEESKGKATAQSSSVAATVADDLPPECSEGKGKGKGKGKGTAKAKGKRKRKK